MKRNMGVWEDVRRGWWEFWRIIFRPGDAVSMGYRLVYHETRDGWRVLGEALGMVTLGLASGGLSALVSWLVFRVVVPALFGGQA